MVSEAIFPIEESPGDGVTGKAVGYSIFTEADTRDVRREAVRD